MCGIAGVMVAAGNAPVTFETLQGMIAMLAHRGPDGHGFYRDDRVGLAHARLSIVDLAGGAQPLSNEDGSLWLSFNGEIFNYLELRRDLAALGHRFSTQGDSEVIVHCYRRYGSRAWAMLNGQFAFALWDTRRRQLWLVRDRLGILPLYYAEADGELLFASEAKALFAGGTLDPRFDPAALLQIFTTWSAVAPRTPFEGVRQVPPATALCFDESLRPRSERYWQPDPARATVSGDDTAAVDAGLEAALERSVALRLRADVPVGAYVSGGLDSSVIASYAKEAVAGLETFGIRFEDTRFDETDEQRLVVRHLGTRHHELMCDAASIRDALAEVIWHCETPMLRTSPVPLFLLSGLVCETGIKTVLTGEGADEILCGYSIFKEDQVRRFWARQPDSGMRPALLRRLHHYVGGEDSRANALWQNFFRRGLCEVDHPFYSHLIRWQNTAWTVRLLAPEIAAEASLDAVADEVAAAMPPGWRDWDALVRAQYIEITNFMSSYLLSCQGDRVAMAHGVEARYPFLDPDLFEFCLALPSRHKMIGTRDKIALRRIARGRLPQAVWGRRKQPFRAPVGPALFGHEAGVFDDLLTPEALAASGLVDARLAGQLLLRARRLDGHLPGEREEMGLVGVLTLQLLARAFGSEFKDRSAAAQSRLAASPCQVLIDRATAVARNGAVATAAATR